LSADEYAATAPAELAHLGTNTGLSANSLKQARSAWPLRTRTWQWLALALVPALTIALFLLWRQRAPAAAPEKPAQGEPAAITLNVTAFPAAARLYLDDQPLASNPLFRTVTRDDKNHRIEARAPGYISEGRELRFDENANIVLQLQPVEAPPASASASSAPAARPVRVLAKPVASQTVTKPSVDCSQPFMMDATGVKRLRPECL